LHVRVLGAEELLRAVDRKRFGDVDELAAAVIALGGIALGVLVGQHASLRGEHRGARVVLGGDELDALLLPPELGLDGAPERGIDRGDGRGVGEHVKCLGKTKNSIIHRHNAVWPHREKTMSKLIAALAIALAYLALAGISAALAYAPTDAWTVWLASGLTLGLLLAAARSRWAAILAGAALGAAIFALVVDS